MSLLLVLHAVRLAGMADDDAVARRFGLPPDDVAAALRDAHDRGWAQRAQFAETAGWWLTESGRAENERLLAVELSAAGAGHAVAAVHEDFLPLNARLRNAVTRWQLRPAGDRLAPDDHTDADWDDAVLDELAALDRALSPLARRLATHLDRFSGYDTRFSHALTRAWRGGRPWVDASDVDSCHRVWFELHEDLVATLGIDRGAGDAGATG
ncbi:hypothetical protein Xcel_2430 [Xylanimonas cellulosilytica DSM 15894]|uniref:Transcriptional regulator n=1 Tax=Xylanimonas cellulosilytica (strain DSM 15894 / JCM 12276 / CECT 5975 / KCTC 9989 / LMG 20990 / NBRC 107835 / XIL07) TaxID=446471 RepID=D1BWA0_XYLCX|nr:hypothetical protein [Xylanimonas cellulosilytica]ACZ31445.1 hypothetical protein Xcel_2430 [Xylanimonas cellulosilytica DSM 15894]